MKYLSLIIICINSFSSIGFTQSEEPIKWSTSITKITEIEYELVLTAKIDSNWQILGLVEDTDGPIPFSFDILSTTNIAKLDTIKSLEKPKTIYLPMFRNDYACHKNGVSFVQRIYIKDIYQDATLEAAFEFMVFEINRALIPSYQCVKFHIPNPSNIKKKRVIHIGKGDKRIYNCN